MRELMAERGLFMTTEILPLLESQGIKLSREQVYRIATGIPQRLSLELLGALCVALECTPNDLIQFETVARKSRAVGDAESLADAVRSVRPVPAKIARPDYKKSK